MLAVWLVLLAVAPGVRTGPSSPPGTCEVCRTADRAKLEGYDLGNPVHRGVMSQLLNQINLAAGGAPCDGQNIKTCEYGQKCLSFVFTDYPFTQGGDIGVTGTLDITSKACLWDYAYANAGDDTSTLDSPMLSADLLCGQMTCAKLQAPEGAGCQVQCTDAAQAPTEGTTTPAPLTAVLGLNVPWSADLGFPASNMYNSTRTDVETEMQAALGDKGVTEVAVVRFIQVVIVEGRQRRSSESESTTSVQTEVTYEESRTEAQFKQDLEDFVAGSDLFTQVLSVGETSSGCEKLFAVIPIVVFASVPQLML